MACIHDLDTFGAVYGELLSMQPESVNVYSESVAFAAATAEGDAARMLHADAQANQDYMKTMLVDVDGRVGGDADERPDGWNLRSWQQQLRS